MSSTKHLYSLLFILASALYAAAICENSPDEEITLVGGKWKNCKWIRRNEDRAVFCLNSTIVAACPQSCGICCEDSATFTFPLQNNATKFVGCDWISKHPDWEVRKSRRTKYCTTTDGKPADYFGDRTIRDACPVACDFCFEANSEAPTGSPSLDPSASPSSSPSISVSPSATPSVSSIPSVDPSSAPSSSPSDSPSAEPSGGSPSGVPSDVPSVSPSDSPSDVPSGSPSDSPSDSPSAEPSGGSPSGVPSDIPSDAPSAECEDSKTFQFNKVFDGALRGCDWLLKNNLENRTDYRVTTYCPNATIAMACEKSCDNCPSRAPSGSPSSYPSGIPSAEPTEIPSAVPTEVPSVAPSIKCVDSTTYQFNKVFDGELRGCDWLLKNDLENRTDYRVTTYCPNATIATECAKSCDNCP